MDVFARVIGWVGGVGWKICGRDGTASVEVSLCWFSAYLVDLVGVKEGSRRNGCNQRQHAMELLLPLCVVARSGVLAMQVLRGITTGCARRVTWDPHRETRTFKVTVLEILE